MQVDGLNGSLVHDLHAGDAEAELDRLDHRVAGALQGLERAHGGQDPLGNAVEAHGELGDDAKRALRANHQAREIVAGGRLACALRGLDDGAVGHDGGYIEHVVAHGAVAHRRGARGARGGHAADGGLLRAGVDGEEQAQVAQVVVELLPRYAGLHHAVEIALVDGKHPVHAREVERDAAQGRVDVAFQRRACAEGYDRHAMGARHVDNGAHVLARLRPDHGVRRLVGYPGDGVGMLAADRLAGLQPFAEPLAQDADGGRDVAARAVAGCRRHDHIAVLLRFAPRLAESRKIPHRTPFTSSCSEVKGGSIVPRRCSIDLAQS